MVRLYLAQTKHTRHVITRYGKEYEVKKGKF